jgi:hypothetical protein
MPDTLPRAVTENIRAFCRTLSDRDPVFVRCRPEKDAVASECFDNVARKVARAGGSIACGWAIWTTPGVYYEAEHHGVWRRRTGELVDVSPQPNLPKRILFLPDPAAVYDPVAYRNNVLVAASEDPAAAEFVALGNRRNEIHGAYRAGGNRLALFTISDQKELGLIEQRLLLLSRQLLRFT